MLAGAGLEFDLAGTRHNEDVQQIATAGPAEVGMGEAHNGAVAAMVAGAPVPAVVVGVRTELHCAEGHGGSGKTMAVPAGTDDDVHVAGHIVAVRRSGGPQHALRNTARQREVGTGGEGERSQEWTACDPR